MLIFAIFFQNLAEEVNATVLGDAVYKSMWNRACEFNWKDALVSDR